MGVGNTVVVPIEAHIAGIAGAHRLTLLGGKGVIGQCQQSWLLLREGLAHRDRAILWARTIGRLALAPDLSLLVKIVEIAPLAGGEEGTH